MLRSYIYKLKPTNLQKQQLAQIFGNVRYVYNWSLNLKTTKYKEDKINLSAFDIIKELTQLKKEFERLNLAPSHSLQHSIVNMETTFKRFYK